MSDARSQTLDELYGQLMRGVTVHTAEPRYDASGDCVLYFAENVATNGYWLDKFVTLFREIGDGRIVGFKVKCVRTVVAALEASPEWSAGVITFADILDAAAQLSADERMAKERKQAQSSAVAQVVIPKEAYT